MAEIVSRHSQLRIDMTPMVDLAFLLVTFFMLTTTFSKPTTMQLQMPISTTSPSRVAEQFTTTLVLDADNRIFSIRGSENPQVTETSYAASGLRQLLTERIKAGRQGGKEAIFLIKPSHGATYQNVVDVLDEIQITNAQVYAVQSLHPREKTLVEAYKSTHP